MVLVLKPGGPIAQLGNLWFFCSALVSDVLLIRLFLVLANVCLLTSALLGFPPWPSVGWMSRIALDTLIWSSLSLSFHGLSLYLLIYDERRIKFRSMDEEQLWRFFYRRSGMGRLEMKQILNYGSWLRVPKGGSIARGYGARLHFHVLVEGVATIRSMYRGIPEDPRPQYSGCCFDMGTLNSFGIYMGFQKGDAHTFSATAETDCLLYTWTIDELATIATELAPAGKPIRSVGAYWRYFTLCQLGMWFWMRLHPNQELLCATGEPEQEAIFEGERSRDFTDPLRKYEMETPTLSSVWHWLKRSFHPFPPAGLRHTALPITGILARNRAIALKTAWARAALERLEEKSGRSEEELAEVSAHSGLKAYEILSGMQSLRHIHLTSVDELLERLTGDGSVPSHHSSVRSMPAGRVPVGSPVPPSHFNRSSISTPSSPVTKTINDVF